VLKITNTGWASTFVHIAYRNGDQLVLAGNHGDEYEGRLRDALLQTAAGAASVA
jgi:hypothetical protein